MVTVRILHSKYVSSLALATWLALQTVPSYANDALEQARMRLAAGQAQQAYDSLQAMFATGSGQPDYERLLGNAALQLDQPTQAVLSFERCLSAIPDDEACLLGLAQAHMQLNELLQARAVLAALPARDSEPAKAVVAQYQQMVRARAVPDDANAVSRFNMWVQAGLGYNSNANTATTVGSVDVPGQDAYRLPSYSRKTDSFFNQALLGLRYSRPLNEHWRLLIDAGVEQRNYWRLSKYNQAIAGASIGLQRNQDRHRLTLKAFGQYYGLGGHSYRSLGGLLGQYAYALDGQTQLGGFLQYTRLHYISPGRWYGSGVNPDANRFAAGLSWSARLLDDRAVAYISPYTGRESTVHSSAPAWYSYNFTGLQFGGSLLLAPRTRLDLKLSAEHRRYDGKQWRIQKRQRSNQYDASLGLVYAFDKRLSIRPEYSYGYTSSNNVLRQYRQHVVSLNLRYQIF